MKINQFVSIAGTCAILSCGASKTNKSAPAPQEENHPSGNITSSLPAGTIIAVPVDAQGKELTEKAEMRIVSQNLTTTNGSEIASTFSQGKQPENVIDELDQNTSTESFCGWHNYRRFVRRCSYHYCYGYGPYGQYYGYAGYAMYQPTYYNAGVPYSWQYQNSYQTPGMNYYSYNNPQTQGQYPGVNPGQPNQPQQQPGGYPQQQQNQPQQQPGGYQQQNQPQQQTNQPQQPQQQPNQPQQPSQGDQYPQPQYPNQPGYNG